MAMILLVEDDPNQCLLYEEALKGEGYNVVTAKDGREALERVGGLDEDYFLFFEETDWCYRIRKGGWAIYHVPHVEICHFQGKSAETRKERAKIEYFRSRYQFFRKHRGRFEWTLLLAGVLIKLSVELLSLFVGSLATLFRVRKLRKKLWICLYLLGWHLRFCPEGMGLREGGPMSSCSPPP